MRRTLFIATKSRQSEVRRVAEGDPLDFEVVSVKEAVKPVTT
jgi:hypothetical protein